jgi:hypothetical protein
MSKTYAVSFGLIVGLLPFAIFQATFVTPNSMIVLLVTGTYLLLKRAKENRVPYKLILFSIFSVLTVPQILPAIIIIAFCYLTNEKVKVKNLFQTKFLSFLLVVGLPFLSIYFWNEFQKERAIDIQTQATPPRTFSMDTILSDFFTFIPHSIDGYQFLNQYQYFTSYLFSILILSLIFLGLFSTADFQISRLPFYVLVLISFFFGWFYHFYFGFTIPPRYGISVIVLAVLFASELRQVLRLEVLLRLLVLTTFATALLNPTFGAGA